MTGDKYFLVPKKVWSPPQTDSPPPQQVNVNISVQCVSFKERCWEVLSLWPFPWMTHNRTHEHIFFRGWLSVMAPSHSCKRMFISRDRITSGVECFKEIQSVLLRDSASIKKSRGNISMTVELTDHFTLIFLS